MTRRAEGKDVEIVRFVVEDAVFDKLPQVCFGVVVVRGVDNALLRPEVATLLGEEIHRAEARFAGRRARELPEVLPYREAFAALGINPNKFLCSIEALLARIEKGKGLPSINPLVDLGNAISLRYALPIGAHDLGAAPGDVQVRFSRGGDRFVPFGEEAPEYLDAGELIYGVGDAVKTRRWIWRQSEQGKVTENTREVFFPLDGFAGRNDEALRRARDDLAEGAARIFGASVITGFVDTVARSFEG